ncbi:MAG: OFA family MFS transporter [Desulfurococcales archaeon]
MTKTKQRWVILVGAIIVMMFISIYQYSWSLFASGLNSDLKWSMTTIQMAFTLYTYAATFIQPFSGYFADKFGPRTIAILGGLLVAAGFLLCSTITSPIQLYLYYTLGSIGVGMLYGISAATAVKWFPDRRGLATGLVTFGFGAGTAIFNLPFQAWITNNGVKTAFLYVGILMLIFIMPFTFFYKYPEFVAKQQQKAGEKKEEQKGPDTTNWKWYEMLKTPQWWVIYISFTIVAAIALLFGAQVKPMAKENKIPAAVLNVVLVAYPLANGFSRIIGGWVSDFIKNRQMTGMIFYALAGLFMIALGLTAKNPTGFATFIVLSMLFAGYVFAFNPAVIGDFYGPRYSTTNYGITYTAKSWGGLISGYITAWLLVTFGSYTYSIMGLGIGALIAAILVSPWVLKKPKKKLPASTESPSPAQK